VFVDHTLAGDTYHHKLLAADFVFNNVGCDISGVTTLGNNTDFFLAVGQVVGQVDTAIAVPDKLVDIFGCSGEAGFIHHGQGSLAESDHHFHRTVFEQSFGNFFNFINII